jgi:rubrerythrin
MAKRKGYICKVCGYFHEGEELPEDFVCPLCNHGVDSFEKVGF